MRSLLIATYIFVGAFATLHQGAFNRQHCNMEPTKSIIIALSAGLIWPVWMSIVGLDDVVSNTSFVCR